MESNRLTELKSRWVYGSDAERQAFLDWISSEEAKPYAPPSFAENDRKVERFKEAINEALAIANEGILACRDENEEIH